MCGVVSMFSIKFKTENFPMSDFLIRFIKKIKDSQ